MVLFLLHHTTQRLLFLHSKPIYRAWPLALEPQYCSSQVSNTSLLFFLLSYGIIFKFMILVGCMHISNITSIFHLYFICGLVFTYLIILFSVYLVQMAADSKLLHAMTQIWLRLINQKPSKRFWEAKWNKHGTCTTYTQNDNFWDDTILLPRKVALMHYLHSNPFVWFFVEQARSNSIHGKSLKSAINYTK